MWLCTKLGFFSIVKKGAPETWQVRARAARDLEHLLAAAQLKTAVIATPQADYACRVVVDHEQLARVLAALAGSIDYSNFKDRVARLPDQRGKLSAYHDFWAGMLRYQQQHR